MRRTQRAIAFAATAASLMVASAMTFAAGSAADEAAVSADAAREAAMVRALDLQGGAKAMNLILPPAAEGAAGNEVSDQGTQGGGLPADRILPDVVRVPDNLASNARR